MHTSLVCVPASRSMFLEDNDAPWDCRVGVQVRIRVRVRVRVRVNLYDEAPTGGVRCAHMIVNDRLEPRRCGGGGRRGWNLGTFTSGKEPPPRACTAHGPKVSAQSKRARSADAFACGECGYTRAREQQLRTTKAGEADPCASGMPPSTLPAHHSYDHALV